MPSANSHSQIAALFRVRPPRKAPPIERTYSLAEQQALAEAKAEFTALEARSREKTSKGRARGPSIKVTGRAK